MKQKKQVIIKSLIFILLIILSISIANLLGGMWHYFFYQIVYCIGISICVPIYFYKREDIYDISDLGIKKLRMIDYIIVIGFVAFSIGGQLINIEMEKINWNLLPLSILPLLMTTFSEEFFFRGFLQIRFAKAFGTVPAVGLSGLIFSIYHLGYPGFRNVQLLIILFLVGIMFALSFKLSNNNVIVSFFVNLPNAYLTYLLKSEKFPQFNFTKQASGVTIIIIIVTAYILYRELRVVKLEK